jgi:uncharacterized protein YjbI with pentapeptide repeats
MDSSELAALRVIGGRHWNRVFPLDLSTIAFAEANFENLDLSKVDLSRSLLLECRWKNVSLADSKLESAIVFGAEFEEANLQRLNADHTYFYNACFPNANVADADFEATFVIDWMSLGYANNPLEARIREVNLRGVKEGIEAMSRSVKHTGEAERLLNARKKELAERAGTSPEDSPG